MAVRLTDIPDTPSAPKGIRLTDIPDVKPKGIRLSDIPDDPLFSGGEGGEFRGTGAAGTWEPPRTLWEKMRNVTMPDVLAKFPFSPWAGYRETGAFEAQRQLKTGDYGPRTRYEMTPMGGYSAVRLPTTQKQLKDIVAEQEKYAGREETIPAAIAGGISELPSYMIEYAAGGGGSARGVVQGLLTAAKITGMQPHRVTSSIIRHSEGGEPDAIAIAKGWGDTYIENLSEMAGGAFPVIARKLPFGGKFIDAMHSYAKRIGMKDSAFWNKISTKAGYHGLLNEWGEERVGTFLRAVTGVEDFGAGKDATMEERLAAGLHKDFNARNQIIELGVLAAPFGGKQVAERLFQPKLVEDVPEDIPPGSNVYRGMESKKIYVETPAQLGAKETQMTEQRTDAEGNGRIYSKETGEELLPAFDLGVSAMADIFAESVTEPEAAPPETITEGIVVRAEGTGARATESIENLKSLNREDSVYRGMTQDEYNATIQQGKGIISRGDFRAAEEGTNFSEEFADAESYIDFGRDDPRKTGKPTYIVEVKKADNLTKTRRGDYESKAEVPREQVTRIWEINAVGDELKAREITVAQPEAAKDIFEQPPAKPPIETAEEFPEQPENPVQKITRLMRSAKRSYSAQHRKAEARLKKKVAKFSKTLESGEGDVAFKQAVSLLSGPLREPEFTPSGESMTEGEKTALVDMLRTTSKLMPLDKLNAWKGLHELLAGRVPQPNQLVLLERVFGKDFARAALSNREFSEKALAAFADAANLPRTLLTSYDLSASLRQNLIAGISHPKMWTQAMKAQLQALGSEEAAEGIDQSIRTGKHYASALKYNLYLPEVSSISQIISERPEEFMSRFAHAIPGIKMSERAFITMGNKMRFEMWSKYMELWKDAKYTPQDYKNLAKYINAVTGRGNLPQFLRTHGAALNAVFFSPRFLFSRLQVFYDAARFPIQKLRGKKDPVAAIAAGDLARFAGVTVTLLALMKAGLGDDGDVGANPLSTDFGKIRVGNTRFDVFGGYQPIMRYAAQLITGRVKSSVGGDIYKKRRIETAGRFIRSKLAPVPSFIVDLYTGTSYVGEEMAPSEWKKQLYTRFFPLAGQDVIDAAKYQSYGMMIPVLPAVTLGIGTQTWEMTPTQQSRLLKDELSRRYYGKQWNDLSVIQQQMIRLESDKIDQLERQQNIERTGFPFIEQVKKEQLKAGRYIEDALPSHIIEDMHSVGVTVGSLARNISRDWSLNDDRYENYQKYTADELNEMLELLTGSERWKGIPDKQKQQLYEEAISRAKANARNRLVAEGIFEE